MHSHTDHIKGENGVGEIGVVFGVFDVLRLDGYTSTFKLYQWRVDLE